jgi:hypothetical protein
MILVRTKPSLYLPAIMAIWVSLILRPPLPVETMPRYATLKTLGYLLNEF